MVANAATTTGESMSKTTRQNAAASDLITKAVENPQLVKQVVMERPETMAEIEARLREEAADAYLERMIKFIVFVVAISFVVGVGIGGVFILYDPSTPADLRDLIKGSLTAIFSGFFGFLTGKAYKKRKD